MIMDSHPFHNDVPPDVGISSEYVSCSRTEAIRSTDICEVYTSNDDVADKSDQGKSAGNLKCPEQRKTKLHSLSKEVIN